MVFGAALYRAMLAHLQREYPYEGCGFLAGRGRRVERVIPMANTERSVVSYTMDGKEQLRVFKELDRRGIPLLGVYHSHGFSEASPSETDRARAFYPDLAYVIVSLAGPAEPVTRAFHIRHGTVSEIGVRVA